MPSLWTGDRLELSLLWYKPCCFPYVYHSVIMLTSFASLSFQGHPQPHFHTKGLVTFHAIVNGLLERVVTKRTVFVDKLAYTCTRYVMWCDVTPCHISLCRSMPCHVKSHVNLRHATCTSYFSCHVMYFHVLPYVTQVTPRHVTLLISCRPETDKWITSFIIEFAN